MHGGLTLSRPEIPFERRAAVSRVGVLGNTLEKRCARALGGRHDGTTEERAAFGKRRERALQLAEETRHARFRDAHTEEGGCDVLELMGFVEDDGVVVGDDAAGVRASEREIREEQVMVHDDQLRRVRLTLHPRDEAFGVVLARCADSRFARRRDGREDRVVLAERGEFGDVPRLRLLHPALDQGEGRRDVGPRRLDTSPHSSYRLRHR